MYVTSSLSRLQPLHRTIRITRDACGMGHLGRDSDKPTDRKRWAQHNALVQQQARYHHCGEAASEKCLSAATFVRQRGGRNLLRRWMFADRIRMSCREQPLAVSIHPYVRESSVNRLSRIHRCAAWDY